MANVITGLRILTSLALAAIQEGHIIRTGIRMKQKILVRQNRNGRAEAGNKGKRRASGFLN